MEKHVIADAGHWLQQEKPDEVNALLVRLAAAQLRLTRYRRHISGSPWA